MKRLFTAAALICTAFSTFAQRTEYPVLMAEGTANFAPRVLLVQNVGRGCASRGAKGPDLFAMASKFNDFVCLRYTCKGYEDGVPVFQKKSAVTLPSDKFSYVSHFTEFQGKSALFWLNGKYLRYAFLEEAANTFVPEGKLPFPQTPAGISSFAVHSAEDGSIEIYAFYTTQKNERPGDWRSADFRPYDATGVYRGKIAKSALCRIVYKSLEDTETPEVQLLGEMPRNHTTPAFVEIDGHRGFVSCNQIGGIYFFEQMGDGTVVKHRVCDVKGNGMRCMSCSPMACSYPAKDGSASFIVSAEGSVNYYGCSGRSANGNLICSDAVALKEKNPPLTGGTLPVPTSVDWDGDGKLDIVFGNSVGNIMFYRNLGTDVRPSFKVPEFLEAGGERIHVQPGYGEDVQGPGESRWGYVGANVYDWNQDGLLDILTNDSRGKHNVYLGTANGLHPEHPLYLDELPLHGMWRCRPGVGVLAGRTVYVTLDDQDEFHLYFREDDYNLLDGGKLHLNDGRNIRANFLEAGGKGRLRFEIVDWDGDGICDLLLSTNKHNMIPADDPGGIPWSNPKELKGSTILFMRNAGTESSPSFEFPRQLKYKGKLIRLGHHACGACATRMGQLTDGLPNILAADEAGNFYLFQRSELSW